ncbi:MAG: glutathione S-transferase family protein [Deltaproteobacteria bacterium]|nr:MAG: glutathione S-transferase family protein [Deltaproteobacteria bacterium]
MGLLVEGQWHDKWYDTDSNDGKFVRSESQFRNWITADGSSGFPAEANRYHLYVSWACPWAHRTLIFRKLKGLEDVIDVSVVHHFMGEKGWTFLNEDGATGDKLYGFDYYYQMYTKADPNYSGRVTVPILWDTKKETIVSNESSEIIRMLNTEFNEFGDASLDFYPEDLRDAINEINDPVYHNVNNGVYKCGFATTQSAYEEPFDALFATLDDLEERLSQQHYLCGDRVTEADWRLFTTLIRFDPVYYVHFKCNKRLIREYPNLQDYMLALYHTPGVAETCNMLHIKSHYYGSHETVNPHLIVPKGPDLDLDTQPKRPIPLLG